MKRSSWRKDSGGRQSTRFQVFDSHRPCAAPEFKADAPATTGDVNATPDNQMGLDIGPKTIAAYNAEIAKAKTIVWNGPMGVFEMPAFAKGHAGGAKRWRQRLRLARFQLWWRDSVAAVHQSGVATRFRIFQRAEARRLEFLGAQVAGVER